MADTRRIVDFHEHCGSHKRSPRELNVSRNTMKKYILRAKEIQEGTADEICAIPETIL